MATTMVDRAGSAAATEGCASDTRRSPLWLILDVHPQDDQRLDRCRADHELRTAPANQLIPCSSPPQEMTAKLSDLMALPLCGRKALSPGGRRLADQAPSLNLQSLKPSNR